MEYIIVGIVCFFIGMVVGSWKMFKAIKDRFDKDEY